MKSLERERKPGCVTLNTRFLRNAWLCGDGTPGEEYLTRRGVLGSLNALTCVFSERWWSGEEGVYARGEGGDYCWVVRLVGGLCLLLRILGIRRSRWAILFVHARSHFIEQAEARGNLPLSEFLEDCCLNVLL